MDSFPRGYLLYFNKKTGVEEEYPIISTSYYIGSAPDCSIRLPPKEISEHHCLIRICGLSKITIHSLNSDQPVLLNGQEVDSNDCELNCGDVIQISDYSFKWKNAPISKQMLGDINLSLNIDDFEYKGEKNRERQYSAPARIEDESFLDSIENNTSDGEAVLKEALHESQIVKNDTLTKSSVELTEDPCNKTPEKDEMVEHAHSFSHIQTPKCFDICHSTPKAVTPVSERYVKETSMTNLTATDVSPSPAKFRGRRSTGIVPCVGTPSDVYRVSKSIITPGFRGRSDRQAPESEKKQCILTTGRSIVRQRSSERKSTPLKPRFSDKSISKESLIHTPIIEKSELEKSVENQNESTNPESRYKFVAPRRRRRFGSNFATENRIAEESETSRNDLTDDANEDSAVEDEESLIDMNSFCDNSELPTVSKIVINGDNNTQLDNTFTIESDREEKVEEDLPERKVVAPKSILTPIPKAGIANREKSAKKVTFAWNTITESSEQTSLASSDFKDGSYSMASGEDSEVHSTHIITETSELESFCRNEELFMEDKTPSELGVSSCSTPVNNGNQSLVVDGNIHETTKTPANSPLNREFSFSVRESNFPFTEDDVDLTRAEKLRFLNNNSANDTSQKSVISEERTRSPSPNITDKFGTSEDEIIEQIATFKNNVEISSAKNERKTAVSNGEVTYEAEPKDSIEIPEIIVTEFIDSNENTISIERSTFENDNIENTSTDEAVVIPASRTPVANYNNVDGMKRIFKTPIENKISYENVDGIKQLLKTPCDLASSFDDLGVQELMKTPTVSIPDVEVAQVTRGTLQNSSCSKLEASVAEGATSDSTNISMPVTPCVPNNSVSHSVTQIQTSFSCQTTMIAESTTVNEETTLMKTCTDDSTQISTTAPCTSTPHPKIENSMQQSHVHQISEISEVRQQTAGITKEVCSKASCDSHEIAVLEFNGSENNNTVSGLGVVQENFSLKNPGTPKADYENVDGIKQIFKTPDTRVPYDDIKGIKEMFKTPVETKVTYENVQGMKEMFKTPILEKSAYEDVEGMKRMFKTPCEAKSSYENVTGVKNLMKTPYAAGYENVEGVKELMKTPHVQVKSRTSVRSANPVTPVIEGVQELPESPPQSHNGIQIHSSFLKTGKSNQNEFETLKADQSFSEVDQLSETSNRTIPETNVLIADENKCEKANVGSSTVELESYDQINNSLNEIAHAEIEEVERNSIRVSSQFEILLPRTDSPQNIPNNSPKKTPAKSLKCAVVEDVRTRSSSRRATPAKRDPESASKQKTNNQENEVRSLNSTGITPTSKRKETPSKENNEMSSLRTTTPIIHIEKIDKLLEEKETEHNKNSESLNLKNQISSQKKNPMRLKNIENLVSPREKRPFHKSDENAEPGSQTSPKIPRVNFKDAATSPFSVVLPIVTTPAAAIDFQDDNVVEEESKPKRRGAKTNFEEPLIRMKRSVKQGDVTKTKHTKSVTQTVKRTRKATTNEENSHPSTLQVIITSPKRTTRSSKKAPEESVESSSTRRTIKRGQLAPVPDATELKSSATVISEPEPAQELRKENRRTTRQRKERDDAESTQPSSGRTTRNRGKIEEPIPETKTRRETRRTVAKIEKETSNNQSSGKAKSATLNVAEIELKSVTTGPKTKSISRNKDGEPTEPQESAPGLEKAQLKESVRKTARASRKTRNTYSSKTSTADESHTSNEDKKNDVGGNEKNVTFSKVSLTLEFARKRLSGVLETEEDEPNQKKPKVDSETTVKSVVTRKSVRVTSQSKSKTVKRKSTKITETTTTTAGSNRRRATRGTVKPDVEPELVLNPKLTKTVRSNRNMKRKDDSASTSKKGKSPVKKTHEASPPIARITRSRSKLRV